MKRSAETQLTKDNLDDGDDIQVIQDTQDFHKADESTLAMRQIRALPKRALISSKPPSLNRAPALDPEKVEATSQSNFGGFSGFGAGTSASSPFTFAPQPPVIPAPSPSVLGIASKSTQSTTTSVLPFSSLLKPILVDSNAPPPTSTTSPQAEEPDVIALEYFKSLRGLNVSFLSAISTAVEKDPFFDVSNLVESYKNLRTTIQSDFDDSSKPSPTRGPATTSSSLNFGAKAPPEKATSLFSLPKPPLGSTEASPKPSLASEGDAKFDGFAFPPFVPPSSSASTQPPVDLTPKTSEPSVSSHTTSSQPPKSAFTCSGSRFTPSLQSAPGFLLPVPWSTETTVLKSAPGSSGQETEGSSANSSSRPASTAPGLGSNSAPNFFATAKPTNTFGNSDVTTKPASLFGNSLFGSNGTTELSRPASLNPDSKDSFKIPSSLFGNTVAMSSSTSTSSFQLSDKPASSFGSASPPKTSGFVFGKPAGSIGNPVGFGFGTSSPAAGESMMSGSSGSAFSFGAPSMKHSESLFSPPMTDKSSESTPQPEVVETNEEGGEEEAAKLLPSHTHDEEGEGEEDEETTHVVRCKVYRLFKLEDKNEWKDLGVGMLRLKKHKETDVRRVLMRNSNTGRILINFRIHESLKLVSTKNAISFVGHEDGTPTSFSVRVKTEQQAKELNQALEREIAAVQAK